MDNCYFIMQYVIGEVQEWIFVQNTSWEKKDNRYIGQICSFLHLWHKSSPLDIIYIVDFHSALILPDRDLQNEGWVKIYVVKNVKTEMTL